MCGIVGYSGASRPGQRERFIALCAEARIRGEHAYGIAWHGQDGLHVFKSLDFGEVMNAVPDPLPERIIFHNRYSTSGDYRDMRNNQPIHVNGAALVFNGTVDMGTKAQMERRYGIRMETENDGEIVMRDIERGEPFAHIGSTHTAFAGMFLDSGGRMFALRNGMRPLWAADESGDKWLVSTRDIALRAKFGVNYFTPVKPFRILEL